MVVLLPEEHPAGQTQCRRGAICIADGEGCLKKPPMLILYDLWHESSPEVMWPACNLTGCPLLLSGRQFLLDVKYLLKE